MTVSSNVPVVRAAPSPTPPDDGVNRLSMVRVSNTGEESQTTQRTCCQRMADGLRRAGRWVRDMLCCCRPSVRRASSGDLLRPRESQLAIYNPSFDCEEGVILTGIRRDVSV